MDKIRMFNNVYRNKTVLITGNTGFKGSWLTIWLLELGAKVYGISKGVPSKPSMFQELSLKNKIYHNNIDIRDLKETQKVIDEIKPDFIFHLAAQALVSVSYTNPIETLTSNIIGTTNVLEAMRMSKHDCVGIFITSDKCYDNVEWEWGYKENDKLGGKDIYSGSKGAAELVFRSYYYSYFNLKNTNTKVATARAGNVIGGGDWAKDRIIPDCIRAWQQSQSVEIRNPKSTRPWQHVLEPLSGYLALGQKLHTKTDLNGESFNFGPVSIYTHTVEQILKDLSKFWRKKNIPGAYKVVKSSKFHEAGLLKLNCDKTHFHLQWFPTLDYTSLINFTGSWYYEFYKEKRNMFNYTSKQIRDYENLASKKGLAWAK